MNYLRIRLILAIYKAFYSNCPQTSTRIAHYNIILKHARVLRRLTNCLIDLSPDLTIEESTGWLAATAKAQINPIYVVAPSTKNARLAEVTSKTSGFVYAASLMGVTGTRNSVSTGAADLVARVRSVTDLPISVGLGVSTR